MEPTGIYLTVEFAEPVNDASDVEDTKGMEDVEDIEDTGDEDYESRDRNTSE